MSADVELNPGPTEIPCGNCAIEVLDADSALVSVECGFTYSARPSARKLMMIWLPQTNPSHGSAQTVITRTFQTPLSASTNILNQEVLTSTLLNLEVLG